MYYDYDNDKNKIQNQSFSPLHLRLSDCMCFYCILRALLYSLERSFKHRGLTSGGVFGQASYEAKNLLCKYINCGSQVVFVTKKHLPPLPAHLDGWFFWQKNHNCAKNLDNKSFSFINVLTKYSTILSNACLIQANYLKVRVLF